MAEMRTNVFTGLFARLIVFKRAIEAQLLSAPLSPWDLADAPPSEDVSKEHEHVSQ